MYVHIGIFSGKSGKKGDTVHGGFMATPGRKGGNKAGQPASGRVFGRPLRDLMANVVELDSVEIRIPHFLRYTTHS